MYKNLEISRINDMETILDRATELISRVEKSVEGLKDYQSEIAKLEAYYTSQDWKGDLAADEAGELPADLKRDVLSEDGIYDLLERNREIMEKIGTDE